MNDAYVKAARQVSDEWSVEILEEPKFEFEKIKDSNKEFEKWMLMEVKTNADS
jgi:hypothetical protein